MVQTLFLNCKVSTMSGHSRPSSRGKEIHTHSLTDSRGQVQNVKASRVYVFGNDDILEEEDNENVEFEMPEIRSRRGQADSATASATSASTDEEEVFFEKQIIDGDTLQSLSLKYSCPMSELKRVNNLMKEQDFYGLRVLKIPMRRHGILSEMVKQEQEAAANQTKVTRVRNGAAVPSDSEVASDVCSDVDFSDPETQLRVMRSVSIRENFSRQGREAERFLNKMDKDLQKFRETSLTRHESLEEVVSMLSNRSIYPLQRKKRANYVDCAIRWWVIILVAVCIAVFVPVILYLLDRYTDIFQHFHHSGH